MNKKISIVIPAYNEAITLPVLIRGITENLSKMGIDFEIIVIDDGSEDDTWGALKSCFREYKQLRCIRFTRNFGKEAAIYAGLKMSLGTAAVVMDADLQHPPDLLPEMIRIWERTGVHIVEAVKEKRQEESGIRAMGSYVFYFLFLKAAGLDLRNSSDYKLLDRKFIEQYLNLHENIRFFRGLTKWFGYSSYVIYYSPSDRFGEKKKSRWTTKSLFEFARNSLISFSVIPLRFVTWLGFATFLTSLMLGVQTLWMKISGLAVEGFTTVILVTLGIGSVIMMSLGLIGEYIARIYEEVKHRPIYVIGELLAKVDDKEESL
jgi:glycosyltransferase involved in cell wall biosynthesis